MGASNRVAMVTGAARGIGRATAIAFAEAGYDIALADIDPAVAEETAGEVEERGVEGYTVEIDVADTASVDAAVDEILEAYGRIDVLVNNAGIQTDRSFLDLPEDEWEQVLGVNLKGTFLVSQRVATEMAERAIEGRIVNVTSVHQSLPRRNKAHYDASKAGIWMLTKDMALELSEHRINVNAVAPGAVETPMNDELLADEETRETIASLVPWDRWASATEVADAIRYLGHGAPDYITGTCLRIDGGLSLAGVG